MGVVARAAGKYGETDAVAASEHIVRLRRPAQQVQIERRNRLFSAAQVLIAGEVTEHAFDVAAGLVERDAGDEGVDADFFWDAQPAEDGFGSSVVRGGDQR